ncbi:hypothetical protein INS49_001838 [Diaporthe citri]|uniref:uncharacterized protein n=1 Tax=Diaporthe citri TaxID=83186 RepID=UPI001C8033C1|nr:uncharacterized protein INS49_001838 [Diaporthe citri]KAG6367645.1 hypothetical protein INS49_001838 [Diaporthe citri]
MQLTSILSVAILPLLAYAQDTTSGTTTLTQTSTMTKTVTLASNTVTMTATNNSTNEPTSVTRSSSSRATATSSTKASSETPGVNGLGNGAASLGSSHVAIAGVAGMLVVALMTGRKRPRHHEDAERLAASDPTFETTTPNGMTDTTKKHFA